jgi:hypothetical protein
MVNKPTTSTVMAFGGAVNTTRKVNETYYENSDGSWYMGEYDKKGNKTYSENSRGSWYRCEYNKNGHETYYEDSGGHKRGTKRGSCDGKVIEVDGKKYKLTEL